MSDNLVFRHLTDFITAAIKCQRADRLIRESWRYKHIQEIHIHEHKTHKTLADRSASELARAIADLAEPTYISRHARQILDLWNAYQNRLGIYLAERTPDNRMHLQKSRETFETSLGNMAEVIKKLKSN